MSAGRAATRGQLALQSHDRLLLPISLNGEFKPLRAADGAVTMTTVSPTDRLITRTSDAHE